MRKKKANASNTENAFNDSHFRGNYNLKTGEEETTISLEEYKHYASEIAKCVSDIIYFANTYYTIIGREGGKQIIKTYPKQEQMIKHIVNNDRTVVLASRQSGKSTSYCIFCLWLCCFFKDKRVIILANKEKTALEFISRIKMAFEHLPKWLKPGIANGGWNKLKIEFSNGCAVEGCATSSDSARGSSANIIILDECAFIPNNIMEELWASVYPVISARENSKCILVSTPNGVGNFFYTTYTRAERGTDLEGFKHFRLDWWDTPGRDESWREKQLASFNGDITKFNQEYGNCHFGGTNLNVFNTLTQNYQTLTIEELYKILHCLT